jgi:tRNA (guanine-N7-)-methyltransferase
VEGYTDVSRTIQREILGNDWRVWPEEVRSSGWSALFGLPAGAPLRLHVDVGFGDGAFLVELARRDPGRSVVGVELSFKRVLKLAHRLSRSELRNVRLLGVDAMWAAREAFEDESVEAFWINFPDPWPKRCHARRRLVEPGFVGEVARRLMIGGSLHIATDAPDYAAAIRSALDAEPQLETVETPAAELGERRELPPTTFQREWAAQGRSCVFFDCRRAKAIAAQRAGSAHRVAS